MRSRCMSLLPRTTLHSDSEQIRCQYYQQVCNSNVHLSDETTWSIRDNVRNYV
jgi:hypothetical protein